MRLISDSIYTLEGLRIGRVYLIIGNDGLSLIDTSFPNSAQIIVSEIASIGYSIRDVRRILITHAHYDHIGNVAALQSMSQAQVYVHTLDAAVTRGEYLAPRAAPHTLSYWRRPLVLAPLNGLEPAPVHRELQDGDVLDEVLPGLITLHMPGHSAGHVVYWLPSRKLLFCGDVVLNISGLGLPFQAFTPDMQEERRSLRKMSALEPIILCPGHGVPIIGGAAALLTSFAAREGR